MKSILLPLTGHIDPTAITGVATQLAQQFRATLTGLFIRPDPRTAIPFMGEGLTADMIQTICDTAEKESLQHANDAKAAFDKAMAAAGIKLVADGAKSDGVRADWRVLVGDVADHVGRRARTADLAVCTQPDDNEPATGDIFNDLLFRSGRSVLMVPKGYEGKVGKHVLVAWNGRAEGARAVGGALPILVDADRVTVLQIGQIDEDRPSLDDIGHYLREHGVACHAEQRDHDGRGVGEQLQDIAAELSADTLVIGAYSHSRWREMILGGATRWLVTNSKLPIFMSH